jgi:hypothetical protein
MKREVIELGADFYAIKFKYHMVTERTIEMAIPIDFFRRPSMLGKQVRFLAENEDMAGKRRADSKEVADKFSEAVHVLKEVTASLHEYVIFQIEEIPLICDFPKRAISSEDKQ